MRWDDYTPPGRQRKNVGCSTRRREEMKTISVMEGDAARLIHGTDGLAQDIMQFNTPQAGVSPVRMINLFGLEEENPDSIRVAVLSAVM